MPDEPRQSVPHTSTPDTTPREARKPALRTMQGDLQELSKQQKISLVTIVGKEIEASARRFVPTETHRRFPKIAALIIILIVFGALLYGALVLFIPAPNPAPVIPTKITIPPPFFAVETSRTTSAAPHDRTGLIRLITDTKDEPEREGVIKRIVLKFEDAGGESLVHAKDFFAIYRIVTPGRMADALLNPFMMFLYYGRNGVRSGFAVPTRDPDRTTADMLSWEPSIARDLAPLFFGETTQPRTGFEDRTYRNIDWRYLKLSSDKDIGIAYMIFPARNLLVVATSKDTIETAISRLLEAR